MGPRRSSSASWSSFLELLRACPETSTDGAPSMAGCSPSMGQAAMN